MYDLSFQPKKEEELLDLLEEGQGTYEVLNAERQMSKSNNPMIKLTLKVWDNKGVSQNIFDYLILIDSKFSERKIRHFCFSSGLEEKYEKGHLNAIDCIGKSGYLLIKTQHDKEGKYQPKSVVDDYIIQNNNVNDAAKYNDLNDDIPFN